jgi:hypothetical protein
LPTRHEDILGGLAALLLGLVAFFLFVGWQTLIPTNIAWLDLADRAMHTLGWMFFRETGWHSPPGLSPNLGIELSSSIAMVDGLPLFALPLKLVAAWLPQPFQYWGYWFLLSFCLQSLFAYGIARQLQAPRTLALLAAGFALITPAFMFRVPMHMALSGHWTILAALYLYVRREPPKLWMWPLLVALTASIHAYLLAMVGAIWIAALLERLWSRRLGWGRAALELAIAAVATLLVLWVAGFFTGGDLGNYGYGSYKLNLLWPILTYGRWSLLFPDLAHTKYDYEGLSFPGIGILALLLLAILSGAIVRLRAIASRRWLPLALVLVLMMVFAFSEKLALGSTELLTVPLPKWASDLASTFRSTGRFIWPLLYILTIGAVVLLAGRWRLWITLPVVLVAFAAQAVDSRQGLFLFATRMPAPAASWSTPLISPFWDRAAAAGYTHVRAIPIINPGHDWKALGYYAVTHGMDIDTAYLGRNNDTAMAALRAREAKMLATGDFAPHTLYELDMRSAVDAGAHLAPDDLLAVIDGRIILAKGGAKLVDGLGIDPQPGFGNGPPPVPWAPL